MLAIGSSLFAAPLGLAPIAAVDATTCSQYAVNEEGGAKFNPTVASIGGRMDWKARRLYADDYDTQFYFGFASEVLWVGTDNQTADQAWVEVGVTNGWEGSPITTMYSAHGQGGNQLAEVQLTHPTPTIGTSYEFSGYLIVSDEYRVTITTTGDSNAWTWSGHHAPTKQFAGGAESTCGPPSQVGKTYVSQNYSKRQSDGAWVLATGGVLFHTNTPDAGSAWCTGTLLFRYWDNDANNAGCS